MYIAGGDSYAILEYTCQFEYMFPSMYFVCNFEDEYMFPSINFEYMFPSIHQIPPTSEMEGILSKNIFKWERVCSRGLLDFS
jgi:hypothetical protein